MAISGFALSPGSRAVVPTNNVSFLIATVWERGGRSCEPRRRRKCRAPRVLREQQAGFGRAFDVRRLALASHGDPEDVRRPHAADQAARAPTLEHMTPASAHVSSEHILSSEYPTDSVLHGRRAPARAGPERNGEAICGEGEEKAIRGDTREGTAMATVGLDRKLCPTVWVAGNTRTIRHVKGCRAEARQYVSGGLSGGNKGRTHKRGSTLEVVVGR
jgi:hypothetical protein